MPRITELPYMSASCTWMAATSGQRAGTAAYFLPVKGHSMTLAADILKVSVPSMQRMSPKETPSAAALSRAASA